MEDEAIEFGTNTRTNYTTPQSTATTSHKWNKCQLDLLQQTLHQFLDEKQKVAREQFSCYI